MSGTEVVVRASAKINLHLAVGPVRADGFHPLVTIYQSLGLYDDVRAVLSPEWEIDVISTRGVDASQVPLDADNLALRAAQRLCAHHDDPRRLALQVFKSIPVAGGMAGGSADAAAALVATDRLLGLETTDEDLLAIAAELGSDVPFALLGGTALGQGRGEQVSPVTSTGTFWWVVVPNPRGVSTASVYAEFDRLGAAGDTDLSTERGLVDALRLGDVTSLARYLRNDLQPATLSLRPDLQDTLRAGEDSGALAAMISGSGPTVLLLCRDRQHADQVAGFMVESGHTDALPAPSPVAGAHRIGELHT